MRRIISLISVLLLTATLLAPANAALAAAAKKTHDKTVEVVSADAAAKTLTLKDDKGENMTVPVEGRALDKLKTLKGGEKVTVTCEDDDKGEHKGIIAIKPMKGASK